MITIKVDPKEPARQIEKKILEAFRSKLNTAFRQAAPSIARRVRDVATSLIEGTPEYASLVRGDLMGEFGIPDAEERLRQILGAVQRGVSANAVPVRVVGSALEGGIEVRVFRSDFEDLLRLSAASYLSQPSGEVVPWLEWLIGGGDQILVFSHKIIYDLNANQKLRSRTGKALMVPGDGWRVPSWASGTLDDNFLTRAFDAPGVASLIGRVMEEEIGGRL